MAVEVTFPDMYSDICTALHVTTNINHSQHGAYMLLCWAPNLCFTSAKLFLSSVKQLLNYVKLEPQSRTQQNCSP